MSGERMSSQEEEKIKFADRVAKLCYSKYAELPKTGKPNSKEWTLLAGIVKVEGWIAGAGISVDCLPMEIVALGTGSKCIGMKRLSDGGDILNDSHAEIMARRGFLRYLYRQAHLHYSSNSSDIFINTAGGKCMIKSSITFHFFTSHMPCGDASIFPKTEAHGEESDCLNGSNYTREREFSSGEDHTSEKKNCGEDENENGTHSNSKYISGKNKLILSAGTKRKSCDNELHGTSRKKQKEMAKQLGQTNYIKVEDARNIKDIDGESIELEVNTLEDMESVKTSEEMDETAQITDSYRTGAKCLKSEPQDLHLPGSEYHVLGALRTKPGRGDPTLSLSCSDKLARWNAVGIQGALLSLLMSAPIYISSLIIGGACPFSKTALHRAIVGRVMNSKNKQLAIVLQPPYCITSPLLIQSTLPFADARAMDDSKNPCSSSVVWCKVPERPLEVAVAGKKQGVTRKRASSHSGRLLICKKELLKQFVNIIFTMWEQRLPMPFSLPGSQCPEKDIKKQYLKCSYWQWKSLAREYRLAWHQVQLSAFPSWTAKPESLLHFSAADGEEDETSQISQSGNEIPW